MKPEVEKRWCVLCKHRVQQPDIYTETEVEVGMLWWKKTIKKSVLELNADIFCGHPKCVHQVTGAIRTPCRLERYGSEYYIPHCGISGKFWEGE